MDTTAERVAKNDATFRDANEAIRAGAEHADIERPPFICECADESCTELVRLSLREYDAIRADPTHFVNVPGHEVNAKGHAKVVSRRDGYLVVEKIGEAAEIVEERDPRSFA